MKFQTPAGTSERRDLLDNNSSICHHRHSMNPVFSTSKNYNQQPLQPGPHATAAVTMENNDSDEQHYT